MLHQSEAKPHFTQVNRNVISEEKMKKHFTLVIFISCLCVFNKRGK